MTSPDWLKLATSWSIAGALLLPLGVRSSGATLDDLKKLEITCFVPSYLPQGFRLKTVEITYDDADQEADHTKRLLPLYSVEYGNGWNATFSIESAREGIGDRNIMVEEDTEETQIPSAFGPMYLIYRPKGKDGRKAEIKANWVSDANMNAEMAKGEESHPTLGRYHGFSATGITVKDFEKIIHSLHPVGSSSRAASATPSPSEEASLPGIHPKVFSMVEGWISDSENPVVTEINLDAVEKNGNEFNKDGVTQDGEWLQCLVPDTNGFMRYRVLESKGNQYKIEYQENGGGTLTTSSIIEFEVEKRSIRRDGRPLPIRVLRVTSYNQK